MLSIRIEFKFVLPVRAGGSGGGKGTHFFKYSKVNRNMNGQSIAIYSASPPREVLALPRPCVSSTDDGTGGGLP